MAPRIRIAVLRTAGAVALVSTSLLSAAGTSPVHASAAAPGFGPPMGPRPQVAYLQGLTLHKKDGTVFTMPFPASHAPHLQLLGTGPSGYVLVDHSDGHFRLYTVKTGSAGATKARFHGVGDQRAYSFYLSHSGSRVLQLDYTNGSSHASVFSVSGDLLGSHTWSKTKATLLDFPGPQAIVSTDATPPGQRETYVGAGTYRWRMPNPPTKIYSPYSGAASVSHNLLFVGSSDDDFKPVFGPTKLSTPKKPASYYVDGAMLPSISRGGTYAVYLAGFAGHLLVVRVKDGEQLNTIADTVPSVLPVWESDTALLILGQSSQGDAIYRCQATGTTCVRTTAVTTDHLSIATD